MLQLASKLAENNIQPIFLVPSRMVKTYEVREVGLEQKRHFSCREHAQHSHCLTRVLLPFARLRARDQKETHVQWPEMRKMMAIIYLSDDQFSWAIRVPTGEPQS